MRKFLGIVMLLFAACEQENNTSICKPGFKPTETLELKTTFKENVPSGDTRSVVLLLGNFTSRDFPEAKSVADSALHIASVLLSSNDFKVNISGLDFTCRNYNSYCRRICAKCSDRFSGSVVLDSLYREKQVELDLFLRDCDYEFGHSTFNIPEVYSCKSVVFYDERKLSPAYCYAYHLAHEYMHIVGFFHTDHVDDVAEKTGWLGWEILLRWRKEGLNVMQIRPGEY